MERSDLEHHPAKSTDSNFHIHQVTTPNLSSNPSQHLTCPVYITIGQHTIKSNALLDSGTTHYFINKSFVNKHSIPTVRKDVSLPIQVIDGSPIITGAITHHTQPNDSIHRNPPRRTRPRHHCDRTASDPSQSQLASLPPKPRSLFLRVRSMNQRSPHRRRTTATGRPLPNSSSRSDTFSSCSPFPSPTTKPIF